MSFSCNECQRRLLRVEDIRNCARCRTHGRAVNIPEDHADSDLLTSALIGYALGDGFSTREPSAPAPEVFSGGGGESAGAGASASWDAPASDPSPSAPDSGASDAGSVSSE